jgi:hypothetical protein
MVILPSNVGVDPPNPPWKLPPVFCRVSWRKPPVFCRGVSSEDMVCRRRRRN